MKDLITINISTGKANYSQRNNLIFKDSTCNTTSMVMGLLYSGVSLPEDPIYKQPEDSLTNFILKTSEVEEEYKRIFPDEYAKYIKSGKDTKESYPPNQLHPVLSFGTNLWLGKKSGEITKFRWDLSIQDILFELLSGRAVVQSGVWAKLNHITCMVGFTTYQENIKDIKSALGIDLSLVESFIMDDPYGDYHDSYKTIKGNDIYVSKEDYIKFVKPTDNLRKWGHTFKGTK